MALESQNKLKNCADQVTEKLLQNIAQEEGFHDYKIEEAPGSVKGDGYMGVITAVRIIGTDDGKESKVLDLVVKSAPKGEVLRAEVPIADMFEREIYMYNTVIPAFQKFEAEKKLPPFLSVPKCYGACLKDQNEFLILKNLKEDGYSLWEQTIPMEHDHVSFVMAEFGRFHALSFAVRDQKPDLFQKLTCEMYDVHQEFFEMCDGMEFFRNQSLKAFDALDPVNDKEARKVFKSFIDEDQPAFLQKVHGVVNNYSVILHGDAWANNMLFKYENESKSTKPAKMCFIDLQTARLGSSVLDLSFFLYSCSSEKVLNDFEYYLDVYYNSLSDYLRKLGSNPEKVYPNSVFRKQWKEFAKFGFICSMFLIRAMLREEDEVTDIVDIVESGIKIGNSFNYDIGNTKAYSERVRPVIMHFINNKFI